MRQKLGRHFSIGISEAKTSLPELVAFDQPTVLLRNNRPVGAILSIREFNEYETLRAAFADPQALRALVDASERARNLPLSELGTEEDLRARFADRARPERASAAGRRSESASGAQAVARERARRRR